MTENQIVAALVFSQLVVIVLVVRWVFGGPRRWFK